MSCFSGKSLRNPRCQNETHLPDTQLTKCQISTHFRWQSKNFRRAMSKVKQLTPFIRQQSPQICRSPAKVSQIAIGGNVDVLYNCRCNFCFRKSPLIFHPHHTIFRIQPHHTRLTDQPFSLHFWLILKVHDDYN